MTEFLGTITGFFSWAISQMGEVLDTVVANPALTVLVLAMPICGFAVGLLNRLIRL